MDGSRTVKTLAVLVVTMTIGAFVLRLLETAPIESPVARNLAAVETPSTSPREIVLDTAVPIQSIKWSNIVIHRSAQDGDLAERCHFVVPNGGEIRLRSTGLWKQQADGLQTYAPGRDYNADTIGICLIGDFARSGPSQGQFSQLVELVRTLQWMCNISSDHVYLYRNLDARSDSPGAAFPAEVFSRYLLRPSSR